MLDNILYCNEMLDDMSPSRFSYENDDVPNPDRQRRYRQLRNHIEHGPERSSQNINNLTNIKTTTNYNMRATKRFLDMSPCLCRSSIKRTKYSTWVETISEESSWLSDDLSGCLADLQYNSTMRPLGIGLHAILAE